MGNTDPETTYQDPDDIHYGAQAPGFIWFVYYILTERYESQHGKFQGLYPEWDPDNGQAEKNTGNNIHHKDDQSTKHYPNNISENIHLSNKSRNIKLCIFHLQIQVVCQN